MEDVVVTATRREMLLSGAPDVLQVITRKEIEELNPSSTGQLLEHITGVSIETGTGSGFPDRSIVGLNGLPANYTLVLLDGVRLLSEHIHTGQNLEHIPPQSIERIEVIRGAAVAQYGTDAIGGVVNIITRKCGDDSASGVEFSGGSYDTYEGGVTWFQPVSDHLRLSLFVHREQSHGVDIIAPAHRAGKMGYERTSVLARADLSLDESTTFFGWIDWVDSTMDWADSESDSYLYTSAIGMSRQLTETLRLFSQVSYAKWDAETSTETNKRLQPEAYLTWTASERHVVTGGVDMKHHEFSRSAVEDTPDQDAYGAFVQDEWQLTDALTVMAALRYDDVEEIDGECAPKLSMVYSPAMPVRLRASVARGFHAPTPQELYEVGYGHGGAALRFGNPDLQPEYSTTYALGVELMPGEPFELMLYGHYSEIDDMIVPVYEGPWAADLTKDVWRRTNIENAEVYGTEIKARYTLPRGLRLEAGYSYTENEDADTGRQLPYDPGSSAFAKAVVEGKLNTMWSWSGFLAVKAVFGRSAWNWKPAAGAPVGDPSGMTTELDDYEKLDAGVTLRYKDTYDLFVNVENILGQNIENLDDALMVVDGRPTFEIGLKARW